ncbi:hypothetical protein PSPO01_13920 [Paraphaeosphaeria sporulosa]
MTRMRRDSVTAACQAFEILVRGIGHIHPFHTFDDAGLYLAILDNEKRCESGKAAAFLSLGHNINISKLVGTVRASGRDVTIIITPSTASRSRLRHIRVSMRPKVKTGGHVQSVATSPKSPTIAFHISKKTQMELAA